jgi:hypothetical protein
MRSAIVAALLLAVACSKPAPAPSRAAEAPADASTDEQVTPVYAPGETVPAARTLCDALYETPSLRRAACCSTRPAESVALAQCRLTVSAALRSRAVSIDGKALSDCAAAQSKIFEGCSWIGPSPPQPAPECRALFRGARKTGEVCRSSLECLDGLHCLGAGPTAAGRCGPPKTDGQACRLAVDALAGFALQDEDARHPECTGFCGHFRCAQRSVAGGACLTSAQCPAGQHCDGSACANGTAARRGERCVGGGCEDGLRCVSGRCLAPLAAGAPCQSDAQCRGGCIPATHLCGERCDAQ